MNSGAALFAAFILSLAVPQAFAQSQPLSPLAPVMTAAFHSESETEEVWNDANYAGLLIGIRNMSAHGLEPEEYGLQKLEALQDDRRARDQIATAAWLTAASHLLYGKLDPVSIEPTWTVVERRADFVSVLRYALNYGRVAESLEEFAPRQLIYTRMKSELAALQIMAATPLAQVPECPPLLEPMVDARMAALQARLVALRYMDEAEPTGILDEATRAALVSFQTEEGLTPDGIARCDTIDALNRIPTKRIAQLRVNMERWRWLPEDLGRRHLRANIAAFQVTAYEWGIPQETHLTIVGKPFRQTPVFSDQVEYVVFNPWWETPDSLARSDKLPLFRKDPGAVERLGFQVLDRSGNIVDASTIDWNAVSRADFPYRLRQAPGPLNALGQVKIMFPNKYSVYLHDTPTRGLFSQSVRAFSSGCIRTQEPIGLAKWVLKETPDWTAEAVDAAVASGEETKAVLAAPVPVHVLYSTVADDGTGVLSYLDDIYKRDAHVLAGLNNSPADD